MSGIYIPGMEMPTNCSACPLAIDNECGITHYEPTFAEWYEDGVKGCPLVPVPEHGRLGDLDELKAKGYALSALRIEKDSEGRLKGWRELVSFDEAPTIIPADKEEQT